MNKYLPSINYKKINDLDVKLLEKVADPNISTEALIALRHLALDYRFRQQELLKTALV